MFIWAQFELLLQGSWLTTSVTVIDCVPWGEASGSGLMYYRKCDKALSAGIRQPQVQIPLLPPQALVNREKPAPTASVS